VTIAWKKSADIALDRPAELCVFEAIAQFENSGGC
jgi:hypothetical protein